MAMSTTGSISIGSAAGAGHSIVSEFGGGAPHSLTEYYRGGSYVPNVSQNNAIATAGSISMLSFRGSTAYFLTYSLTSSDSLDWYYGDAGADRNITITANGTNGPFTYSWSLDTTSTGANIVSGGTTNSVTVEMNTTPPQGEYLYANIRCRITDQTTNWIDTTWYLMTFFNDY